MWDWTYKYKSAYEFLKMNLAQIGLEHAAFVSNPETLTSLHIPLDFQGINIISTAY